LEKQFTISGGFIFYLIINKVLKDELNIVHELNCVIIYYDSQN